MSTHPPEDPKPRLLVIDDEPMVGTMMSRLMRRRYDVTAVTSSREGLRLATSGEWDVIICDVMMPGMSGPELFDALKETHVEVAARVGFMTGGAFDPEIRAFLDQRGDEGWLAKPFGRAQIEQFVESIRASAS